MAKSIKPITITGNVGGDPRVTTFEGRDGRPARTVASFSVACNISHKNPDGSWADKDWTDWFNIDLSLGPRGVPAGLVKGAFVVVAGGFEIARDNATGEYKKTKSGDNVLVIRTDLYGLVIAPDRRRDGEGHAAPAAQAPAAQAAPVQAAPAAPVSAPDDDLPF
jgi:single-stranded DNA-binding protein